MASKYWKWFLVYICSSIVCVTIAVSIYGGLKHEPERHQCSLYGSRGDCITLYDCVWCAYSNTTTDGTCYSDRTVSCVDGAIIPSISSYPIDDKKGLRIGLIATFATLSTLLFIVALIYAYFDYKAFNDDVQTISV